MTERPDDSAIPGPPGDIGGILLMAGALLALGLLASWSWLAVVVGIVAILFFHELGHFLSARWTGMKPTEFFIGFGPRLWSFRRGETEYGVKAIPAGAYVRIVGMSNLEHVEPSDTGRAFRAKSYPRKLLVASAGPLMNFGMALVLLYVAIVQFGIPEGRWEVDRVVDRSAAASMGLLPGDRIIAVDGESVDDFGHFGELIAARGGRAARIVYERDGETVAEAVTLGVRLTDAGAAAFDGLIPGDRILAIDGVDVFGFDDVVEAVDGRIGQGFGFLIDPAGGPELLELDDVSVGSLPPADEAVVGFFGIGPREVRTPVGMLEGVPRSVGELGSFTKVVVLGVWDFFAGGGIGNFLSDTFVGDAETEPARVDTGRDRVRVEGGSGGPDEDRILSIYGAAQVGADLTDEGPEGLIMFLAGLNLFVGLFNLIPLPPLDGGHVAVATYERIRSVGGRRHEVDYAKLMPLTYAVVFALIAIGLVALFRDIVDPVDLG